MAVTALVGQWAPVCAMLVKLWQSKITPIIRNWHVCQKTCRFGSDCPKLALMNRKTARSELRNQVQYLLQLPNRPRHFMANSPQIFGVLQKEKSIVVCRTPTSFNALIDKEICFIHLPLVEPRKTSWPSTSPKGLGPWPCLLNLALLKVLQQAVTQ